MKWVTKTKDYDEWHLHFALLPTIVAKGSANGIDYREWAWLETVERKVGYYRGGRVWFYRRVGDKGEGV